MVIHSDAKTRSRLRVERPPPKRAWHARGLSTIKACAKRSAGVLSASAQGSQQHRSGMARQTWFLEFAVYYNLVYKNTQARAIAQVKVPHVHTSICASVRLGLRTSDISGGFSALASFQVLRVAPLAREDSGGHFKFPPSPAQGPGPGPGAGFESRAPWAAAAQVHRAGPRSPGPPHPPPDWNARTLD